MLSVLIVSTVFYAGSLGVEIHEECRYLLEQQEERIRQIVAAKSIREKTDFVLTTGRGTKYEFGDSYGVRRVSAADGRRLNRDGRDRCGDCSVGESANRARGYLDRLVYALHELFGKSATGNVAGESDLNRVSYSF